MTEHVQPGKWEIPRLGTVEIHDEVGGEHFVEITLADDYEGDLVHLLDTNDYPGRVLFHGSEVNQRTRPALHRFMETLHQHDSSLDGDPDWDHVVRAIDDALDTWNAREGLVPFVRAVGGLYTSLLIAILPPQPDRHIVHGFGRLRDGFSPRRFNWLQALVMLGGIITLVSVQIHFLPFMSWSVLSGWVWLSGSVGIIQAVLIVWLLRIISKRILRQLRQHGVIPEETHSGIVHSPFTRGFFPRAAYFEEACWREGAENWTTRQRMVSHFSFGAIHMTNLIYPLAAILPLSIGGYIFMRRYLRTLKETGSRRLAVYEATLLHLMYNTVAITAIALLLGLSIFNLIVTSLLSIVALVTIVALIVLLDLVNDRVEESDNRVVRVLARI